MQSSAHMPSRVKALGYLTFIVLAIGVVLRALYLDADPQYDDWIGYIIDEGRWVYQARDFYLFHTISRDAVYDLHLILAPLFQLVNYVIFDLIGFSRLSTRIFTAFCGSALLLLFWKNLRHTSTPLALLIGVILLAVQVDFVVMSRVAVPEMVVILFQALAYFVLVSREPSPRRMALLGAFMLFAVGMKGTVVFSVGIFSLILLFMPAAPDESTNKTRRWPLFLWFWGGLAAPVLLAGAVWIGCCAPKSQHVFDELSGATYLATVLRFLRFSDFYHILSFPFKDSLAPALNFLALGLWLSWLGWIAADRKQVDVLARRYLVTSTTWIVAYLALMLAMDYFPSRYMVHIVLPMAINITVGMSLLQKVGIQQVLTALQRKDRVRLLRLAVFVLPTAVFIAPLLASAMALGGINPEPLRIQLACVALAAVATTFVARQVASRDGALNFLIVFPIMQAALWMLLSAVFEDATLWPRLGGEISRSLYAGIVVFAAMASLAVTSARRASWVAVPRLVTIYALGYFAAAMIRLVPAYLDPHYTSRDISRDLGVLLDGSSMIATKGAEGLFNDNSLRYQRFNGNTWKSRPPEIVVTGFPATARDREILETEYHVIKTYTPYISSAYHKTHPEASLPEVKVYRKNH